MNQIGIRSMGTTMEMKMAIEDKNALLKKAYNRGDASGCAAVFAEDALFLPPNRPMLRGKQAIQELIQG
jgi:ketosteroid isomerase-like protein